jgi:hypothetical protein
MRMTGPLFSVILVPWNATYDFTVPLPFAMICPKSSSDMMAFSGQRIIARLREQTYAASLQQEVEFVERGEGDVLSRLSVDTTIVGERYARRPDVSGKSLISRLVLPRICLMAFVRLLWRLLVVSSQSLRSTPEVILNFSCSGRHVLHLPTPDLVDARLRPPRLPGRRTWF